MSLAFEATSTHDVPAPTAGQLYMENAIADLPRYDHAPAPIKEDVFFQASMHLVQIWKQLQLPPRPPKQGAEQPAPFLQTYDELPHETTSDRYNRSLLRSAYVLVGSKDAEVSDDFKRDVYVQTVDRAVRLRRILRTPLSEKRTRLLQQQLGAVTGTSLLNLGHFAATPMPHQVILRSRHPFDGTLLEQEGHTLSAGLEYAFDYNCAGFSPGHNKYGPSRILATHLKRTHVLSVCCDLRLISDDGRADLDHIIDALNDDVHGRLRANDRPVLYALGRSLARTIIENESRLGSRLTSRESRGASAAK